MVLNCALLGQLWQIPLKLFQNQVEHHGNKVSNIFMQHHEVLWLIFCCCGCMNSCCFDTLHPSPSFRGAAPFAKIPIHMVYAYWVQILINIIFAVYCVSLKHICASCWRHIEHSHWPNLRYFLCDVYVVFLNEILLCYWLLYKSISRRFENKREVRDVRDSITHLSFYECRRWVGWEVETDTAWAIRGECFASWIEAIWLIMRPEESWAWSSLSLPPANRRVQPKIPSSLSWLQRVSNRQLSENVTWNCSIKPMKAWQVSDCYRMVVGCKNDLAVSLVFCLGAWRMWF